ncbi:MAG: hypothetical protein IJ696_03575 [Ruminococcus sp.]|nr:hypothetical protein [Ruminococcus sp.]
MRNTKTRLLAFAMALFFGIIILGSLSIIAAEAVHDCDGEECSVCELLQQCERLLTSSGSALSTCASHFAIILALIAVLLCGRVFGRINTLISLKVELLS